MDLCSICRRNRETRCLLKLLMLESEFEEVDKCDFFARADKKSSHRKVYDWEAIEYERDRDLIEDKFLNPYKIKIEIKAT